MTEQELAWEARKIPFKEAFPEVTPNSKVYEHAWVTVDRDYKITHPGIYDGVWIVTSICGDFARLEQPESGRIQAIRTGHLSLEIKPNEKGFSRNADGGTGKEQKTSRAGENTPTP